MGHPTIVQTSFRRYMDYFPIFMTSWWRFMYLDMDYNSRYSAAHTYTYAPTQTFGIWRCFGVFTIYIEQSQLSIRLNQVFITNF